MSATVHETTLALSYGEVLDADAVPPASAFTVQRTPQGGNEETVGLSGSPAIAGGAVLLTLASPVLETDTDVKVSYDKSSLAAGNRVRDDAGNEAAGFTNQAVDPTDATPPRLVRGEIDGDTMTIYFSEALDEDLTGNGDRFRITLAPAGYPWYYGACPGVQRTFTTQPREVYVRGNTAVVVGLYENRRAIVDWMYVQFRYVADAAVTKRLRDLSGNPVTTTDYHYGRGYWATRSIYLENVTGLPSPDRVTVVGDRLTLTFDAPLQEGSKPAADAFTAQVNGSPVSLAGANAVSVSGRKVTLTLAAAVAAGDDVTASYERPPHSWLRNVVCEYAESFSDEPALNFTGVSPATAAIISDAGDDDTYRVGDVIRVRLTFSEAVTVNGAPRLRIKMDPYYGPQWANYESGSGTSALTFAYQVAKPNHSPQGIAVLANTLELKYGALRYTSSGEPAYLEHAGLDHDASHKVDWWTRPPSGVPYVTGVAITSDPGDDGYYARGDGIQVTLTFSEAVNVTGRPRPRLKIRMHPDGGTEWANYQQGMGTNRLTFAYYVAWDTSPQGVAVLGYSLDLNGGAIRSTAAATDADLWYGWLPHDPNHKVDWRRWR